MDLPVLSAAAMRAAEEMAFSRGVTAEALMDEAAVGIAATVTKFFPSPGRCIVFAGKGNNAGDAFAAAELLRADGWSIELRLAFPEDDLGELARKKLAECGRGLSAPTQRAAGAVGPLRPLPHLVLLDGLLGLGAKPPLREPIRAACREINNLRREENAFVVALDLPTGLDGDTGEADADCVVADVTATIGFAKRGLLADDALNFVGRLEVVPLRELRGETSGAQALVAVPASLRNLLPRRKFGAYKNQFGRIGVVAGSKAFTGASILCTLGALRAGAGLVELFVPEEIYQIVAASAPPEAMVKPIQSYRSLGEEPIDVWAVGPGLGVTAASEILGLIETAAQPMVIDADGLNILSQDMAVLTRSAGLRLLTPHPGEMHRLFPAEKLSRAELVTDFCQNYSATLLLKGSRTLVAEHNRPISYNTTGNPGMATGGMGDVLTGVCAALITQKLTAYDAARTGAWVCGRAAEIAIFNGTASEQSLLPSDLLMHLGAAFRELA
ncbi:MAG: NAD(P)H-hydrate dehydratase [Verrucomicrobiota bacterium]|nr:NAD(P)H-hydrate dehydratase [Verrucomicrobiota bacterium]